MAKKTSNASTDAALTYVKDAVERMVLLSGEPADYAGVAALTLADVAVGAADVTVGAGTGGRQYAVVQKTGVPIDATGTANHVALVKDSATAELLDITTTPSTEVASGGTATINSWTRLISDPT